MRPVHWIHLSDLGVDSADGMDEGKIEADLRKRLERDPWRLLIVTGNLAGSPSREDFATAVDSLDTVASIAQRLTGEYPLVIQVPGQHDFQRDVIHELASRLYGYWDKDPDLREEFWRDSESPLRKTIRSGFERYVRMVQLPRVTGIGLLPSDYTCSLPLPGSAHPLGILVLNTSVLHGGGMGGMGELSIQQVDAPCDGGIKQWISQHAAWILVTHHGPHQLTPWARKAYDSIPWERCLGHFHAGRAKVGERSAPRPKGNTVIPSSGPGNYSLGWFEVDTRSAYWTNVRLREPPAEARSEDDAAHERLGSSDHSPSIALRQVTLQDFRGAEKLELDLLHPDSTLPGRWTCLAGINGAGKTTVLQAISMALLGHGVLPEIGGARLASMCRLVEGQAHDAKVELLLEYLGEPRTLELRISGESTQAANASYLHDNGLVIAAYGATRNLSSAIDPRLLDRAVFYRRHITLFEPLAQIVSAEEVIAKVDDDVAPALFGLVKEVIGHLLQDLVEVVVEDGEIRFVSAGTPVPPASLPDGFRSTIAWIVDMCVAWCETLPADTKSTKSEDVRGVVLVDEIDLHLHPSLQRVLVPRLRELFPGVQWIVTTHSPLVLGSFDRTEIIALDRSEPGGVRALDRQITGFTTDEIYSWLMGVPPQSTVADAMMRDRPDAADLLVEVSPDVSPQEAAQRVASRRARFERLRRIVD